MSALISCSLLRSCAHSLRSVDGLKYSKTWKLCSTSWVPCCRSLNVDSPPQIPTLTNSYVYGTSSISMVSLTVGQMLDSTVQRWPDREAVVFVQDGIRKTFALFQQDVDKVAAGLLALGLKPGDRLGVWGPNTYEWILFQIASAKAGIILVSVNPAYQMKEVEFTLKKVQCKAVVCPTSFKTQNYCEMLRQLCPDIDKMPVGMIKSSRLPDLRMVIVTDSRQPGMLSVEDVMQAGESRHYKELMDLQTKLSCDDPINIQFTSGTTGRPKGATLSHHNIVNNTYFMGLRMVKRLTPPVRICMQVPMYHCFGSVMGGITMAVHGATLVFPSAGYNSRANLEAIQAEKCNVIYGTPTMYTDMLNQQDLQKYDLSSIETCVISGSPCPSEIVRKLRTDMNIEQITIGYGATETSPLVFLGFPKDNKEMKLDTVGCIMNHTEAKVVDITTGEIVPLGSTGELMIKGYCVMHGYWDDPEKTSEAINKAGWYRTGDMASLNSLGYCSIRGRLKDMIIRGGENIYPAEIEEFLFTHPKVQEVQVVGVKDSRLGEQVCACIRLKEGQTSSAEEIRTFCKGKVSHFKIPHYVVFVDSFLLTVTGKVRLGWCESSSELWCGPNKQTLVRLKTGVQDPSSIPDCPASEITEAPEFEIATDELPADSHESMNSSPVAHDECPQERIWSLTEVLPSPMYRLINSVDCIVKADGGDTGVQDPSSTPDCPASEITETPEVKIATDELPADSQVSRKSKAAARNKRRKRAKKLAQEVLLSPSINCIVMTSTLECPLAETTNDGLQDSSSSWDFPISPLC